MLAYDPVKDRTWQAGGFTTGRDGNLEISATDADGSDQVNLSQSSGGLDDGGVWSPDGRNVAFTSNRDGDYEIYVMNADGSGVTQVTNNTVFDGGPAWTR